MIDNFDELFKKATGNVPFPFQRQFAAEGEVPELVDVPTGLGKTAMAVLGWLWRRRFADGETRQRTPRRLVYCLPMRVLVEQTQNNAVIWLHELGLLAGSAEFDQQGGARKVRSYAIDMGDQGKVPVHVLMGGEDEEDWDLYPERDQVIVGTQDMLLSRALNRGYAASRSRWPIHFGLLNTDCLWVFDEVQLMGAGLATTTQLEAFRRLLPDKGNSRNSHGCRSVWMSATMRPDWLKTVNLSARVDNMKRLAFNFKQEIATPRLGETTRQNLQDRWVAKKPINPARSLMGDTAGLAGEILEKHRPGTLTIVVVNTVKRSCELFEKLKTTSQGPEVTLLHSRFRPGDRKAHVEQALSPPGERGTIVVSTQVIEAGVDVSATTLFTELAPWASLVQRFGRCNRRGRDNDNASVYWVRLPAKPEHAKQLAGPYELDDLEDAEKHIGKLTDVGLESLKSLGDVSLPFEHTHVIRRKDVIDLFDTTPDLAGNDIDIDRFVREIEDSDVRVFWRDYDDSPNETEERKGQSAAQRDELCPAPIGSDKNLGFRQFVKEHAGKVWRWDFMDKKWERASANQVAPGQVFLVHAGAGGYAEDKGWDLGNYVPVTVVPLREMESEPPESTEDERLSHIGVWQTVAKHTEEVCDELGRIVETLSLGTDIGALRHAARWHDRGKAHQIFQNAVDDGQVVESKGEVIHRRERPQAWRGCRFVAKAPDERRNTSGEIVDPGFWRPYEWSPGEGRKYFRHELASALSVLDPRNDQVPSELRNVIAYLIAAHHGKVRLSIRSLPNERRPGGDRRFARGVWDNDELPATDLGRGITAPALTLSLEPMEMGLCEEEPFAGQPSWAERMIRLLKTLGPFRLAYLEAILRAADMRASRAAEQCAAATESPSDVDERRVAGND